MLGKARQQGERTEGSAQMQDPGPEQNEQPGPLLTTVHTHSAQRDPKPLCSSLCGPGHLEGNQVFALKATRKKTSGSHDFLCPSNTP